MKYLNLVVAIFTTTTAIGQPSYQVIQERQLVTDRINSDWAMEQSYVVLVSIDGFRHDYATKFGAKNILAFSEKGASANMIPSFPSKTFPNHYTIVTGLRPGNHGIVSNEFYSRSKDQWYRVGDKDAVRDSSWYGGTPLWVLAEQMGMLSASFFWVGSEANIGGLKPTYNYTYDGSIPNKYRLCQVIDWLKQPGHRRPHFLMAYFSLVDDAGHRYGPEHEKTREAVLEVDALIGAFMDSLDLIDLPVNVVLVSDHGMSSIDRGLALPELIEVGDAKVSYSFPPMIYQSDSGEQKRLLEQLSKVAGLEVYRSDNMPDYLNLVNEDRVGDLVLLTQAPTIILERKKPVYGGTHGFDPSTNEEMQAIFYAKGPDIRTGVSLSPFENIHVYPFISAILGLSTPKEIDGTLEVLKPAIKD